MAASSCCCDTGDTGNTGLGTCCYEMYYGQARCLCDRTKAQCATIAEGQGTQYRWTKGACNCANASCCSLGFQEPLYQCVENKVTTTTYDGTFYCEAYNEGCTAGTQNLYGTKIVTNSGFVSLKTAASAYLCASSGFTDTNTTTFDDRATVTMTAVVVETKTLHVHACGNCSTGQVLVGPYLFEREQRSGYWYDGGPAPYRCVCCPPGGNASNCFTPYDSRPTGPYSGTFGYSCGNVGLCCT